MQKQISKKWIAVVVSLPLAVFFYSFRTDPGSHPISSTVAILLFLNVIINLLVISREKKSPDNKISNGIAKISSLASLIAVGVAVVIFLLAMISLSGW